LRIRQRESGVGVANIGLSLRCRDVSQAPSQDSLLFGRLAIKGTNRVQTS
jgi:hypothetical protein